MACRGWRFSVVKNRFVRRDRSLYARSRLVVKFFFASSRFAVKSRGTGPSRLSQSKRSAVRDHSSRRQVATASLFQKFGLMVC